MAMTTGVAHRENVKRVTCSAREDTVEVLCKLSCQSGDYYAQPRQSAIF